ncbi:ubiquinone biosynthesis regulatory protein kinase UbiB [Cellvibrio sp. QJXJ]|uniref:ubiquinone biosynthesis regulatory protein kinase UbiB n=1 Tax=Cellvibrio sp. QJXJ TaxID=2964606 RepID=UPI0021C29F09|nr:ubiquinone biosynthesis regulatory protein kinase UbiB [Cellvibrio sp. QJXJ]UUA71908.1 ubiquinone biosynthesis regulatory protein kinase UbiB [Cellvibrio sp. QJXJ]
MIVFFRLLKILRVFARYRLDQLLPTNLPFAARTLLLLFKFFPQPTSPSGEKLTRGECLRRACEDLGPIFVKFGQLLSTRPDLVPGDIVLELNHLQDNVAPFANDEFQRIVETSLGAGVDTIFASYDKAPLASASVAQVHTAVLKDGREVVIKVVRPGIEQVIEQDIELLLLVARWVEKNTLDGKRLHPVEIVQDYRTTIFDELDLQREAANASQLRRNFLNSPLLYVPEIYWDYTRSNVLVMERIYGIPVTDINALTAQHTDMKKLAERGVEIFFTQVFEHNFFHADMHPGNIFVSTKNPQLPQYIAVDMAIVGSLTREDQYYLARNLLAMFRRDYRLVAELHVQSGWVPKTVRVEELEAAIRTVCEPIFEKPLKEISFANVLLSLFRTARRFDMEVQPQLVLLQKTLLNIEGLGRQLYPDLDLWATAHPFLERWLKNRFHPKSLWGELKRYAPEWMEKFPQVPDLIFNSLQQLPLISQKLDALERDVSRRNMQQHRGRRKLIALVAFGAAGYFLYQDTQGSAVLRDWLVTDLSAASIALVAIGLVALWFKK